jgi:hypothetical protein
MGKKAATEEYITMTEASRRSGMSPPAITRRVRSGELPTYRDARDTRVRLVKVSDLDRLLSGPKPIAGAASTMREVATR